MSEGGPLFRLKWGDSCTMFLLCRTILFWLAVMALDERSPGGFECSPMSASRADGESNVLLCALDQTLLANNHLTHNSYTSDLYCTQRHSYCTDSCDNIFTRILIVNITSLTQWHTLRSRCVPRAVALHLVFRTATDPIEYKSHV